MFCDKLALVKEAEVMNVRGLKAVILLMLKEVEGERTSSSVFHLLKGKKSAQTIQDAHLYKLTKWFQTAPFLTMPSFEQAIADLLECSCLAGDVQRPFVTKKGQQEINRFFDQNGFFPALSGWQLSGTASSFFSRLQLLLQVVSHLSYGDKMYYPVSRDENLHKWIKTYFKQVSCSKEDLAGHLRSELFFVFERQPEKPECLLLRCSGHGQTGKTVVQAAEELKMEQTEYWFRFLHILHAMIKVIRKETDELPLLSGLLSDIYTELPLTESARQTAELLKKGMTIEQIAASRRLKQATVEDHIVELTLNDPVFTIEPFIEKKKEQAVLRVLSSGASRQLKTLKDQLPDHSYFQIRLVLAKESRDSL